MRQSIGSSFTTSVLILCLGLSACSGGGGSNQQSGQLLNLTGYWQANTISNLGYNTSLSGHVIQSGNQISGTMTVVGSPCATSSALSGTIAGMSVALSLMEGVQSVSFSGTVSADGNSITGTYQAPAAGCTNGDSGTFTATRSATGPPATITAVGVSCSPTSIQVGQTSKCTASVTGTGAFSSAVTWSVDDGSINESGNYTASGSPGVANVQATSVQDTTKSGSASITVNSATLNWGGGPSPTFPVTNECFSGDFNGDKKTDIACYISGGVWSVALSTGTGWNMQSWGGGPGPALPVTDQCVTGDFNGDGKTDLACYTGSAGEWNVALSTGIGWQSETWNGGPLLADEWNVIPIQGQCFAADFNGDGMTDLACSDGVDSVWSVALSTGSGWNTSSWSGGPVVPLPMTQQCFDGDFNGDGKADLGCWTGESGGWAVALSTGTGWQGSIWSGGAVPSWVWNVIPVGGQCFVGDSSGDARADISCPAFLAACGDQYGCTTGTWNTAVSTGTGWDLELWGGGPSVAVPVTNQCVTGDFNGDAKMDIACWTGEGAAWDVALSTGTSWGGGIWNGGPTPAEEWYTIGVPGQCFTGDFNGDGKTDIACYSGASGVWNVAFSTGSGW